MIRMCAVCKKTLGEKEPLEDKRISHTYCTTCGEELLAEIEVVKEIRNVSTKVEMLATTIMADWR